MREGTEKKKRTRRGKPLGDFTKTATGEYAYTGSFRTYHPEKLSFRATAAMRLALGLGALVLVIAAGCIPVRGMFNCIYVIVPYVLTLISSIFLAWRALRIVSHGSPMREYVYQATVGRVTVSTGLTAATAVITAAAEVVFLCLNGVEEGELPAVAAYFAFLAGSIACSVVWNRLEPKWKWLTSEANEPK